MQRGSAPDAGHQMTGHALARIGGGVRGERQQREEGRHGPLRGSRAGDRFALTVISLALDEVDAAPVPNRDRKASVRPELSPTSR
jgi:hypothetical protein